MLPSTRISFQYSISGFFLLMLLLLTSCGSTPVVEEPVVDTTVATPLFVPYGLKLKQKLQKAISIIQQNNNYPEDGKTLDTLKNDIQNGNEDVSITKLNTFVHNDLLPNPKTLILQYINMEKLIAFMLSDVQ